MAPKKRSVGSRARKRRRRNARGHHDAELVGLGLVAVGVFLACVLWFGLAGGPVADGVKGVIGWAAFLVPLVAVPVRALIVTRSALLSVPPLPPAPAARLVRPIPPLRAPHTRPPRPPLPPP